MRGRQVVGQDVDVDAVETALLFGYVLVLPFTLFVPGWLRLWRRREVELLGTVQVGLFVLALAWLVKGVPLLASTHAVALIALAAVWVREGNRRRPRAA